MIAGRVQDTKSDDGITFDLEEDLIREPFRQQPAESAIVDGKALRGFFEDNHRIGDRQEKLVAQPRPLALVPIPRLAEVGIGCRTDENAPAHRVFDERI